MADDPSFATFLHRLRQGDDDAANHLFEQFARRLAALAQRRLGGRLGAKVDGEDVMLSAMRSVCLRLQAGKFELSGWDGLWALLAEVTLRKCGRWRAYFNAEKRSLDRELSVESEDGPGLATMGESAAPDEGLQLEEAFAAAVAGLSEQERHWVRMSLEGWSITEISQQFGCDYHKVWRTEKLVIDRLKRMRDEA